MKEFHSPKGEVEAPLKALLFDSWFDPYRGVIVLVRIVDGTLRVGDRIRLMSNGAEYLIEEIGYLTPSLSRLRLWRREKLAISLLA